MEAFTERVAQMKAAPRFELRSRASGYVQIRLGVLRDILVDMQRRDNGRASGFADAAGVKLVAGVGAQVENRRVLALVRGAPEMRDELEAKLARAIYTSDRPGQRRAVGRTVLEEVTGE